LKHHREETNKREILLQESIAKNDAELQKDRELFKNLNNHHNALKKQLDQLGRERDENDQLIRSLRDKEHTLNERLKGITDELARSEGTNIKVELRSHVEARRKHLDEVRAVLETLSSNLAKVNSQEE